MFKLLKIGAVLLIIGVVATLFGFLTTTDAVGSGFTNREYVLQEDTIEVGSITDVNINVDNRAIIVGKSTTGKIELSYYEAENDEIDVTETGSTLSVDSNVQWYMNFFSGWSWMSHANDEYFVVYLDLPETVVYDLDADTTNGAITLLTMDNFGDLILETTNGAITLTDVSADTMDLDTSNGDLHLDSLTADSITAYTTNGRIEATDLTATAGSIGLETTNGAIEAENLATAELICTTTNGPITVSVTGTFEDYATRLDTTNGTIYVDGDVTDDGHYNTGMSDQIDISTTNGSIHLNFLG